MAIHYDSFPGELGGQRAVHNHRIHTYAQPDAGLTAKGLDPLVLYATDILDHPVDLHRIYMPIPVTENEKQIDARYVTV